MDYRKTLGKAKNKLKDLGSGDGDVIDAIESGEGIDPLGLEKDKMDTENEEEYVRGEDMIADMERDIEISRNRRDDSKLDMELDDLDDL